MLEDTNQPANQSTGVATPPPVVDAAFRPQQPAPQAPAATSGRSWSFNQGGLFAAPIGRGLGSEYLTKLAAALTLVYQEANKNVEINLLTIDNVNETMLAYSAIIVCLRMKETLDAGVAFHVLMIEATGEKISPLFEQVQNQTVEITRLTCDAFDDVMRAKVLEKVKQAFPSGPYYFVDGEVVPKDFNPEDKYMVHRLALNAGLATGTELEIKAKEFEDINIASAQHDSNLQINIAFPGQQMIDAVGEPMRSDSLINFSSQRPQQQAQRNSINSGDREHRIAEISAFLDLLWAPVSQGPVFNQWVPQGPMATQKYAARLVITNLVSNFAYTPSSILLSLVTALSLRDDNNWVQAFRPLPVAANEVDLRDIGALNIEANLSQDPSGFGVRIDTKADSFRLDNLGQLVASLIQPGLIVSLDVPECGPQTWYMSVFSAASSGSIGAYNVLYRAAMELTNGNFGKHFPEGSAMFTDVNNRVHLGHWTDRAGMRRDIRDIDMLAVANLVGDRNPQLIREWSDTWTQTRFPLAMRMAGRKKMIHGLTNDTAEFTGFADRVTFTSAFLDALARGCKEAGLNVRVNTPLSSSDFNNQRGVAGFVGSALLQQGQNTFMTSGAFGYQNPAVMNPMSQGRW